MKQRKIAFSYRPGVTSRGGILTSYLLDSPENTKDKILKTAEMCWLSIAYLEAEDPNATKIYIENLKQMLKHIRLLTDLHEFDKGRAWDIIEAELRDFNKSKTNDEKLDKIIEMLENGTPVKVGDDNSDSDSESERQRKKAAGLEMML